MSTPYTTCEYIGRNGHCGKRCFGGRCNIHRKKETLALCLEGCGRGTASKTGYCARCGYKQMTVWRKMKNESLAMDAQAQRERNEIDEAIDDILSWDWPALLTVREGNNLSLPEVCAPTIAVNGTP